MFQKRSLKVIRREISGIKWIDKIFEMDKIVSTPCSNLGTYTGLITLIRKGFLFYQNRKMHGYTPSRFKNLISRRKEGVSLQKRCGFVC